ncbi:MAG: nitroreductase, partial [Syntrophomonadaceae bacterium]|nr:nitroreductase [Syntrophomonadaceae bacterium]
METRTCIKERRSMRKFTEQEVSDEQLHELLEAVRWSPSWANTQCWEVVVIKDQARKEQLAAMLSEKNPATKGVVQAPLVLVICAR